MPTFQKEKRIDEKAAPRACTLQQHTPTTDTIQPQGTDAKVVKF